MKKAFASFLAIFILFFHISIASASQDETTLLNTIVTADHLTLADICTLLTHSEYTDPKLVHLRQLCDSLTLCQGLFIQEKSETTGKTYTATVEFYFNKGIPFCHIDYTNYSGILNDAPVESAQEEGYLLAAFPTGTFLSRTQHFTIHFSSEYLHIQWSNSDYILNRSTGDVSKYTDEPIAFKDREIYQSITGIFDKLLDDIKHQYVYREDEKTFYVYITMGDNLKTLLLTDGKRIESNWNSILNGFLDITETIATAISLDIREGFGDFTEAHCAVMFVDTLNDQNYYTNQNTLAIIKDGVITFDLLRDIQKNTIETSVSSHSSYSPTLGEKNALLSAKQYLNVTAFSKSGLIDQLIYEGYSQQEAEYAVNHCNANWYEQAAKSAKAYLNLMAFSRSGLIDQLEYEGFTYEQAVYGVTQNGY